MVEAVNGKWTIIGGENRHNLALDADALDLNEQLGAPLYECADVLQSGYALRGRRFVLL